MKKTLFFIGLLLSSQLNANSQVKQELLTSIDIKIKELENEIKSRKLNIEDKKNLALSSIALAFGAMAIYDASSRGAIISYHDNLENRPEERRDKKKSLNTKFNNLLVQTVRISNLENSLGLIICGASGKKIFNILSKQTNKQEYEKVLAIKKFIENNLN